MTDTRTDRLATLRRNLDRLTDEAESLAGSVERESRLVSEETVGAELLATRDLVANFGIAWDAAEQLGSVYARQARYLVDDHAATLKSLMEGASQRPLELLGAHLERRFEHLTEGMNEGLDIVSTQTGRACEALLQLWAPFVAVVRQDWSSQRSAGG